MPKTLLTILTIAALAFGSSRCVSVSAGADCAGGPGIAENDCQQTSDVSSNLPDWSRRPTNRRAFEAYVGRALAEMRRIEDRVGELQDDATKQQKPVIASCIGGKLRLIRTIVRIAAESCRRLTADSRMPEHEYLKLQVALYKMAEVAASVRTCIECPNLTGTRS